MRWGRRVAESVLALALAALLMAGSAAAEEQAQLTQQERDGAPVLP